MSKTTIVNEAVFTQVDENGVIIGQDRSVGTRTIYKQEPPYIKLYLEDILYMADMPKSLSGLTYSLAKRATFADKDQGLIIYLPLFVKQQICDECGYEKMQSLTNAIGKLCKGNIIRRLGTGAYQLNPYLFGRGEWKDIDNIRATWDYDAINGRTFSASFTYKDENGEITDEQTEPTETSTDTLRGVV